MPRDTSTLIIGRPPAGGYAAKLRSLAATLRPGTVTEARVAHDPGCALLAGGVCDCDPDVELVPLDGRN